MPIRTDTYTLEDVRDDLTDRIEKQADRVADLPDDSEAAAEEAREGHKLDRYRNGIEWAIDTYGEGTTITLGAITLGEREFISDLGERFGSNQNAYIAVGTRDAPYLEHDPDDYPHNASAVGQTILNIPDMHPGFADWLNETIGKLGQTEADEGKSFQKLVQEKRRSETSADRS